LEVAGLGKDRLQCRWVSSTEGQLFADYVTELTEVVWNLGPLNRDSFKLPLAAAERALHSMQLRWLMNMERQLTERENVFHEKLNADFYQNLLKRAVEEEYQKSLLWEVLQEGPRTVHQMAEVTGLPVYTISLRLNDLERMGLADISGHEGTIYSFKLRTA
jgi:hypothetical protein